MEIDLKGLLSDVIHVNDAIPKSQYRLTIKRFKRLPVGKYSLIIDKHEWELNVRIIDHTEYGDGFKKVGYLRRKGWFNSYHFTDYCKDSGRSIEVFGSEVSFGLLRGAFHINDTNLIGQLNTNP